MDERQAELIVAKEIVDTIFAWLEGTKFGSTSFVKSALEFLNMIADNELPALLEKLHPILVKFKAMA